MNKLHRHRGKSLSDFFAPSVAKVANTIGLLSLTFQPSFFGRQLDCVVSPGYSAPGGASLCTMLIEVQRGDGFVTVAAWTILAYIGACVVVWVYSG